jgi:predicted nucleic acid-binding protein
MSIDRVVVNSSPLIVLFSSGQEALLGQLWYEVLVPGAVWREVLARGPQDAAAQQLPTISWARQVEVPVIAPVIAAWNLGPGESEVLTFASDSSWLPCYG